MVGNPSRVGLVHSAGFDSDFVVHGGGNSLCAAEVAFSRLYRDMAEQKLNLLKLSACCPTEASACPAQVMGRQSIVADSRSEFFEANRPTYISVEFTSAMQRSRGRSSLATYSSMQTTR